MFGRFMPQEGQFFEFFNEHAQYIVDGARELADLMAKFDDLERRAYSIETIEKKADKVTHQTVELLHKTFITPLDREDIHKLITTMDDILDLTEDVAHSIFLYDIKSVTPEAQKLADICVACGEKVKATVALLPKMENSAEMLALCAEIDKLESDADHVMRAAMAKLFREEPDVRNVIKLKEIYELLESVTDKCEDVANIIEGIIVENA
ncbi:MAG: phosphate transport regulator [Betaproteobacteria bacterium]|nr:phosphate transport regulator [Betaproteobacteria bacterium]